MISLRPPQLEMVWSEGMGQATGAIRGFLQSKHPVKLSITDKFSSDHDTSRYVGETAQPAPHDGITGWRIAGAGEITAEPRDLD